MRRMTWLIGAAALAWLRGARRRGRTRSRAEIVELENATFLDPSSEAVTSVQKAELLIDRDALVEIWTAENLERLAIVWRRGYGEPCLLEGFGGRITKALVVIDEKNSPA